MDIQSAHAVAEWKSWKNRIDVVREEIALWNRNLKTLPSYQQRYCQLMLSSLEHELDQLTK